MIEHPPVYPIPMHRDWVRELTAIAQQPLGMCPAFPEIAARHEAWWHGDLVDRPLVFAHQAIDPVRRGGRHLDLLISDPDRWFEETRADMLNTRVLGDSLPNVRVDFGPVILGGLTSVPGAIVGGLIIGVGEKLSEVFLGPYLGGGIEIWFGYVLVLFVLLVRPQGLFGEKIIDRV